MDGNTTSQRFCSFKFATTPLGTGESEIERLKWGWRGRCRQLIAETRNDQLFVMRMMLVTGRRSRRLKDDCCVKV